MPRPLGSKNTKPAGVRVNAIVSAEVAQWLKGQPNMSKTIQKLCEDEIMKEYEKPHQVWERLHDDLQFDKTTVQIILGNWPIEKYYDWLMTASKSEVWAVTASKMVES